VANVTSSGNTTIKPTINAAKFMGSSHAAGSSLSNQVHGNTFSINVIKNILDSASLHSHIDIEEDGSTGDSLEETNNILMDIGNALSLDFANRITEGKEEIKGIQAQKSKEKFGRAESKVEGKGKKIGSALKGAESKAASPVQGIFGKIMSFLGLLGTGIAANAGFEWLKDDKNKKKLSNFFNFMKENWKWMVGAVGLFVGAKLLFQFAGVIKALGAVFSLLTNPVVLAFLAFLGVGLAGYKIGKPIHDARVEADDSKRKKLIKEGVNPGKVEQLIQGTRLKDAGGPGSINNMKDIYNDPLGLRNDPLKFHKGGIVTGPTNEVPAILERGELVIPKQVVATLSQNPKKSGLNITTINMPGITEGSIPQGSSTVATAVPNIAAANFSDPYRQLTPKIYGIYV